MIIRSMLGMHAKKYILALVFFIALYLIISNDCKGQTKSAFAGFDEAMWKKDSTGCLGLRGRHLLGDILFCGRAYIRGMSKADITSWLGNPNQTLGSELGYYMNGGVQCIPNSQSTDVRTLYIVFKGDIAHDVMVGHGNPLNCTVYQDKD